MAIRFMIRGDMSPKELLAEIHGRISGETQVAIQEFERRLKSTSRSLPTLAIRVDEASQTAVVRVMTNRLDGMKLPSSTEYASYALGINDEGEYFAHEIQNVPNRVKNMAQLMDWMNRVDEGYTHRVQGDILLQFVRCEGVEGTDAKRLIGGPLDGREIAVNIPSRDFEERIGNHQVIVPTDGIVREVWTQEGRVWTVSGRELVMLHPQHLMRVVQIPRNTVAVLTAQRGRADQKMLD